MTRKTFAAAVGIAIASAWAGSMSNRSVVRAQEKSNQARWEYRVILAKSQQNERSAATMTEQFNALAAEGWEYVGAVVDSSETRNIPNGYYLDLNGALVLFKRPK
jgi:hypothetical protein